MRRCIPLVKGFLLPGMLVFFLSGCTTLSQDSGFSAVQSLTPIGTKLKWIRSENDAANTEAAIAPLLTKTLTVDDTETIALLNNKGLQASYAELGIAEANLVQAGRIPNPTLSFGHLTRGGEQEIERTLMLPILNLLTMPISTRIEKRRFEQAQLQTAIEVLRIADETRRSYFSAVAAAETVKYMEKVTAAAEAGSQLAQRMNAVGNWSALQQAREQSFYTDATVQLVRARQTYQSEREKLIRLMGLGSKTLTFQLPDRLPELPKNPKTLTDAETIGLQNRLDILMAKRELAGLADSLHLTNTTRFINLLDVSYLHNSVNESPSRQTGYKIELQIPLFDWGSARVAKAEALYMQAVNRAAEITINAHSEIREAYLNYHSAYNLAKHYRDEVVPLKKRISDEQLLRYNGMLISVFELLADSREQAMTVNASIEALRDYWMADSALQMALTGRSSTLRSEGSNRSIDQGDQRLPTTH
ncbi:MAG: TolC family protein [Pseudomonadota bacterium]